MKNVVIPVFTKRDSDALSALAQELRAANVQNIWIILNPNVGMPDQAVQNSEVITRLEEQMRQQAAMEQFEQAADTKKKIEEAKLTQQTLATQAYQSISEAGREIMYQQALHPILALADTLPNLNISYSPLPEIFAEDNFFMALQAQLPYWPTLSHPHGAYSIIWPRDAQIVIPLAKKENVWPAVKGGDSLINSTGDTNIRTTVTGAERPIHTTGFIELANQQSQQQSPDVAAGQHAPIPHTMPPNIQALVESASKLETRDIKKGGRPPNDRGRLPGQTIEDRKAQLESYEWAKLRKVGTGYGMTNMGMKKPELIENIIRQEFPEVFSPQAQSVVRSPENDTYTPPQPFAV